MSTMPRSGGPASWQQLQDEMEQMFERFTTRFGLPMLRRMFEEPGARGSFSSSVPAVDVSEDEKSFVITAELPGMSEKDVDVTVTNDMLTIKGEKREESETKEKNYYVSERRFGSFQRSFPLSDNIDRDKIEATFDKGMLTLTLPKAQQAMQQHKKIEVKAKS
jgi:HSP20 family protein